MVGETESLPGCVQETDCVFERGGVPLRRRKGCACRVVTLFASCRSFSSFPLPSDLFVRPLALSPPSPLCLPHLSISRDVIPSSSGPVAFAPAAHPPARPHPCRLPRLGSSSPLVLPPGSSRRTPPSSRPRPRRAQQAVPPRGRRASSSGSSSSPRTVDAGAQHQSRRVGRP